MGILKIFAAGRELDYRKDTINVKEEFNAFSNDFKVPYSNYPFLIIENDAALQALGARDITSLNKKKLVPVTVIEGNNTFAGQLEIIEYQEKHRKCNLKFGSAVLPIMDKSLLDLLPSVNVSTGTEQILFPYTEKSETPLYGHIDWELYPLQFIGKIFPEVNFTFPRMQWADKFGKIEVDDFNSNEWYRYLNHYNNYYVLNQGGNDVLHFLPNRYSVVAGTTEVFNTNIPSPQLFVLGILRLAFKTIGYTIDGNFTTDPFICRLAVLSLNDNLCKVNVGPAPVTIPLSEFQFTPFGRDTLPYNYSFRDYTYNAQVAGDYTFRYKVVEPIRAGGIQEEAMTLLHYSTPTDAYQVIYANYNNPQETVFEGETVITITNEQIEAANGQGVNIKFGYWIYKDYNDLPISFEFQTGGGTKVWHMMHPTIKLGRYAPQKTLAAFINDLKNTFNLDITIDDIRKKATFTFAKDIVTGAQKHISKKSLKVKKFSPQMYTGVLLKYANKTDNSLYISSAGTIVNYDDKDNFTNTIENPFKLVDLVNGTADLSKAEEKDGIGLMIINPDNSIASGGGSNIIIPGVSSSFAGHNLNIDGPGGLYDNYWKATVKFMLNASVLEMEGPFTESEINDMKRLKRIYLDNQAYAISELDYTPSRLDNYLVRFTLLSIAF